MERAEIVQKIEDVIVEQIAIDASDLSESTAFEADLEADSLDMLQIVTALEDAFGIEVDDSVFEQIKTIGDAASYVERIL